MQKKFIDSALRHEEGRTVKLFLIFSFAITIIYDLFYFYIYPQYITHSKVGFYNVAGYFLYLVLFTIIPVIYFLNKKKLTHYIKYFYFITYTMFSLIIDVITYINSSEKFGSGNAVEAFMLLISPIFVNNQFFRIVSIGLMLKYVLLGVILQEPNVILPIVFYFILSIIAYILLIRFQSYVSVIKKSYDQQLKGIVKGIIATLEMKDPYTRGHSERVAQYALLLAKETGQYTNEELKSFNYACLLHDIGKIQITDSILMKPGKLTEEEYKIVQSHPVVGEEAVKDVEGLKGYLSVIRSHHERWDGRGYPDKLKGTDTPFLARIVSIADAFDAMTSSRSYRSALPLEEAYKRIIEGQGTQFDPDLVDTFKKIYPIWEDYHTRSIK